MKNKALLISHDIGGFRPAYHFIQQHYLNSLFSCEGPARLELEKLGNQNINDDLNDLVLNEVDIYITTGWQTDFEKSHMHKLLPKYRDQIYVCLDHWVNYEERVIYKGSKLPIKNFCVFDIGAKLKCEELWPKANVFILKNYFDLDFVRRFRAEQVAGTHDLFLSDPISEHYRDTLGYDEFDQIDFIYSKRQHLYSNDRKLIIRPHPSESPHKYEQYIDRKQIKNSILSNSSLETDFALSANVFGASSYAMHLAILAGKNVFCSIPIPGIKSLLPHSDIRYLVDEKI